MTAIASFCNCRASQRACTRPCAESGMSVCPQKRCCVFHAVSPCRTSQRRLVFSPSPLWAVVLVAFASTMNRFFSYRSNISQTRRLSAREQPAFARLDLSNPAGIECTMRCSRVNDTSRLWRTSFPYSIQQKKDNHMQNILNRASSIAPLDTAAMELARTRQQQLTKPAGSLGRLEDIAIHIAGITRQPLPRIQRKAVIIMAGDHGVTSEGVSAYPSAVTPQMVHNFLQGGAAINALARYVGARVIVVDVGVAADIDHPGLLSRKVAFGTANIAVGPAMTQAQMLEAIQVGMDVLDAQVDE